MCYGMTSDWYYTLPTVLLGLRDEYGYGVGSEAEIWSSAENPW